MSHKPVAIYQGPFEAIVPGVSQKVLFTNVSAQSAATQVTTNIVQLKATEDCWVVFGADPTAVANDGASFFVFGGTFEYYGITPGQKIAVIRDSTNGALHIIEGG